MLIWKKAEKTQTKFNKSKGEKERDTRRDLQKYTMRWSSTYRSILTGWMNTRTVPNHAILRSATDVVAESLGRTLDKTNTQFKQAYGNASKRITKSNSPAGSYQKREKVKKRFKNQTNFSIFWIRLATVNSNDPEPTCHLRERWMKFRNPNFYCTNNDCTDHAYFLAMRLGHPLTLSAYYWLDTPMCVAHLVGRSAGFLAIH